MDPPAPRTLRDKEAYLGLDFDGLATKEARDFVKNKIVRMNKKFCHLDGYQIRESATVLQYINSFFDDLLRMIWEYPDRAIDGSDRQMFVDIMRKKIIHFGRNYPHLAERARKVAKHRSLASHAASDGSSDSDDTDEEEEASLRATNAACKLDSTPYFLVFKIASEKLETIKDRFLTQEPSVQLSRTSSSPARDLLPDFLPHTTPSLSSIEYEPAFPSSNAIAAAASRPSYQYQIPTPSVEARSVKAEPAQEPYSVLPRLRPNKGAATRADPEDVFVEICIASDSSIHSIHALSTCMTMPNLFTKIATELQIYSIDRMSAEFKDDNVVRFWKCDLEKNGSHAAWRKTVQLACERQTDVVDGTIVVTVDPRDFTPLIAIDD